MGAILNGLALHGGIRPYGGTFLVFADYMRPSIRLAALSRLPVVYVFTHDSIGVGEDGPTHQPIEHLASLRAIPNLTVIRPADAAETAVAWRVALERAGPVALVLTRQKVPVLDRTQFAPAHLAAKGAYILAEAEGFSRARYHPAMKKIRVRLVADPKTHKLLGCAMVGGENLKERADFLAFAMRKGSTLEDIARMENCYSPPIGALNEPMALAAQAGLKAIGAKW